MTRHHRLIGLEPDNLLAFLALLGVLRALEAADRDRTIGEQLMPRALWDPSAPPLRPALVTALEIPRDALVARIANGIRRLTVAYSFNSRRDLRYSRAECRDLLVRAACTASSSERDESDVLAALTTDAAIKDPKTAVIDPTPLCLLFGQGHQHFLERLAAVPALPAPPSRGRGKSATVVTEEDCLAEALFARWHREDPTPAFRWDPEEDVRYALLAGDPTDPEYKGGTQHGANRLAAIGLASLTIVPERRAGRVRPSVLGGLSTRDGFSFAWPIWTQPASLAAIRAMLGHPELRTPNALAFLSVQDVLVARRISVGKFMNFSRARSILAWPTAQPGAAS